jgi:multicomponent Na+:H+ antiporter subunit D
MTELALAVVVPLTAAVLTLLLRGRALTVATAVGALATIVVAVALAVRVADGEPGVLALGGWAVPLGIELRADGLSALLVLMTAAIAGACAAYAGGYLHGERGPGVWSEREAFWPLWFFLWASLNALFLSGDVFNIYVSLELVTLSGIALLVLGGGREALAAGMRYLLAAFLGSLAYLMGVGLLYAEFGRLDIQGLGAVTTPSPAAVVAIALMTAGLLLKTALFPLHFLLPAAHASAPAPVSAALSALVVKTGFYVLLRIWFFVAPGTLTVEAALVIGILGSAAILWGSLQAIRSVRLKLMVAHSTVAQVGYLFLLVPLVTLAANAPDGARAAADAWNGGIYQVLSHAFAKAAMFLAAGTVLVALGHDRVAGLHGIAARAPIALFAFGAAGVSLIGLPPMGGFVAKLLLLQSAVASGTWWIALVLLAGGILTAGYVFLVVGRAFSPATRPGPPGAEMAEATPGPWTTVAPHGPLPAVLQLVPLALAIVGIVLGLGAALPLELAGVGSPFPVPAGGWSR